MRLINQTSEKQKQKQENGTFIKGKHMLITCQEFWYTWKLNRRQVIVLKPKKKKIKFPNFLSSKQKGFYRDIYLSSSFLLSWSMDSDQPDSGDTLKIHPANVCPGRAPAKILGSYPTRSIPEYQ